MWLWLTPQSHVVVEWVNDPQPHSDTLIYLTIYNASKWWQLYPHTYNHIRIQSCSFFYFNSLLLKVISLLITLLVPHVTTNYWAILSLLEPYLHYWNHASHTGAITPLPKPYFQCQSHNSTYLPYLTVTPSTFGLSIDPISVLMPWYLNFLLSIDLLNWLTPCYLNLQSFN
jgi:hypothetical protein